MIDQGPFTRFCQAIQAADCTDPFPALSKLCHETVGHHLFSCSAFRIAPDCSGVAARVFSSDEANYPRSGLKEIIPNRWTETVIDRGETFVANSVAGFADVFPDHELIASLGLGSVVNLPVIVHGAFIGTVNMLHEPGYYSPERLRILDALKPPAMLAFHLADASRG